MLISSDPYRGGSDKNVGCRAVRGVSGALPFIAIANADNEAMLHSDGSPSSAGALNPRLTSHHPFGVCLDLQPASFCRLPILRVSGPTAASFHRVTASQR